MISTGTLFCLGEDLDHSQEKTNSMFLNRGLSKTSYMKDLLVF